MIRKLRDLDSYRCRQRVDSLSVTVRQLGVSNNLRGELNVHLSTLFLDFKFTGGIMSTGNSIELLRPKEAAKLLAISERTLWTYSQNGTIPYIRIGRNVRYIVGDLKKALQSLKIQVARNQ